MKKFKILIYFFLFFCSDTYADTNIYEIKAKIINYDKSKNTIIAIGNAEAKNLENKKIFADQITYNKDLYLITTKGNSGFFDNNNLSIFADSFEYDTKLRTIFARKNVIIILNDEKFEFNDFKYYEPNQSGSGNKFKGKLKDGSTVLAESAELSQQSGIKTLTHTKYTPCKETNNKNNEFCPSWSASSSAAIHDKESQTITYKNALLNLKNIPVMYVPYLTVPDPTVKRQSGFLSPSFQKLSNIASTVKLPYFFAISDDKDLTLTPVFYSKENHLYLGNYRQKFKNSYLEIDTSFTKGYDNLNETGRTAGSRNHLFANFQGNYKDIIFDNTDIKFKLQNVNNSTYLLVNHINTNLVQHDLRNLENSIEIYSYSDHKYLGIKAAALQNLDDATSKQYEYILPQLNYSTYKNIENHRVGFSSSFLAKNFSTNQTQENFKNTISTTSNQHIFNNYGLGTTIKTNITNINLYNDNVTGQKNNLSSDNYFTLALDNSYPMYKKNNTSNTIEDLTPRLFIKYTTGSMSNQQSLNKILAFSDVYSMNRVSNSTDVETGFSVGTGFEWGLIEKNKNNDNIFKSTLSLGQIFKDSGNVKMPISSSLQNSSSDIVGSYKLEFYGEKNNSENISKIKNFDIFAKNKFSINYEFNLENSFSSINRNLLTLSSTYKTNYFGITFEDKRKYIGDAQSINLNFKKLLFDSYLLQMETNKNLKEKYTQNTNITFSKEDDCIQYSIGYAKQEYQNQDLRPGKSIYFSITLKPFGEAGKADLSNFIK